MSTDNSDDGEDVTGEKNEGDLPDPDDATPDATDDDPDVSLEAMTAGQRPVIAKEPIRDPEIVDRLMQGAEIIADVGGPASEEAEDPDEDRGTRSPVGEQGASEGHSRRQEQLPGEQASSLVHPGGFPVRG